jgi:NTP pyrophosphatase (non-canonical NTP hydrolase)
MPFAVLSNSSIRKSDMGYMTDGLTFRILRDGNVKRLPLFKRKDGKPAHMKADGSDWSPASWLQAIIGELGEYANLRKKVERGDYTFAQVKEKLASELADVVIYLDLLAYRMGIDLGEAVMATWNKKAADLGIPMYLDAEDWHYSRKLTNNEEALLQGHKLVPCPKCGKEGESDTAEAFLTCAHCGFEWNFYE